MSNRSREVASGKIPLCVASGPISTMTALAPERWKLQSAQRPADE
jgi:hypothetical protein